jgi:hypothetical protein
METSARFCLVNVIFFCSLSLLSSLIEDEHASGGTVTSHAPSAQVTFVVREKREIIISKNKEKLDIKDERIKD